LAGIIFGGGATGDLLGETKQEGLFFDLPVVEPSIQTDWSTCSSIRGMQKYSLEGSSIWTLSLDRISLPNKGIRILETSRNKWQKWSFPQSMPKAGQNIILEADPICPEH
jgi:hypothetical protein